MTTTRCIVVFVLASLTFVNRGTMAAAPASTLRCGELLDVKNARIERDVAVDVVDGKIARVAPWQATTDKTRQVIDLRDQICMPGWIDTHVHMEQQLTEGMNNFSQPDEGRQMLDSSDFPRRNLLAGFTTVRDLASMRNTAIELRNAVNAGKLVGSRIIATRAPISAPGGHGDALDATKPTWANGRREAYMRFYGLQFVSRPSDVDDWFRNVFEERPAWLKQFPAIADEDKFPDAVKVMASGGVVSPSPDSHKRQLSAEIIGRVVTLAKTYEARIGRPLPVAAHAHGIDGIYDAARGGVHSIEHATELGGSLKDDMNDAERKTYEELRATVIGLIKEKHIYVVPTALAAQTTFDLAKAGQLPPVLKEKALKISGKSLANLGTLVKLGVPMAFGSDTGVSSHGQNWKEFVLLVEKGGMPPMQAFQMATIEAARLLRRDGDLGALDVGLRADIIALPRSVMQDISRVSDVGFVMKDGVVYKRDGRASL